MGWRAKAGRGAYRGKVSRLYFRHQDMVNIVAAFHQALKDDPNFGSLSETALDGAIDKVCIAQEDAKVIDALRLKK